MNPNTLSIGSMFSFRGIRGGVTALALTAAVIGCTSGQLATPATVTAQSEATRCTLTLQDRLANAKLTVPDFDYIGTTSATARALGARGCYARAAEAGADYLARVHIASERDHSNVIFHIGQNLAMSGDEINAARTIAAAKRPSQPVDAAFDWNTYVIGTWAFMTRDRSQLESAYQLLSAKTGDGNITNAKVLAGLIHCYGEPYASAYSPRCNAAAAAAAKPQ